MKKILGAALAETAIVMSFTLLVMFGTVQIALIGFLQTQLDGATFMYSHNVALGSSNNADIDAALGPIFPGIPVSSWSIASNVISASGLNTDEPVNFTQWGTLTKRFGGAAILRDQLIQTKGTFNVSGLYVLGSNFALSAGNVEGKTMVGNHDDDAQGAGYNSGTVWSSLKNPITQDDQNVPPYYFTFAYMSYCTHAQFQGGTCNWYSGGTLRSLGLAEFLKDDQTGNEANYNTSADGIGTNGTFQTLACHQRIYSDLAAAFPTVMPSPSPIPGSNYDETTTGPTSVAAWGGASFELVYSWDVQGVHSGNPSLHSFGNQYPLSPEQGCTAGGPGA